MQISRSIIAVLCVAVISGCITNPEKTKEPLSITYSVSHLSLNGANDGAIDITVTGGEKPYSFTWSNGAVVEDIIGVGPGLYSVTVTDSDNNMVQDSMTVEDSIRGEVTDVDGNIYRTIKIGEQWWMTQDLKVTHGPAGNPLQSRVYGDNPANEDMYGRLYTWDTAMNGQTGTGVQGIAPDGWHIPTIVEFQVLIAELGGSDVAGGKLKAAGEAFWNAPNTGGTNASGFNGRGSGEWDRAGLYQFLRGAALYWASTGSSDPEKAQYLALESNKASTRFITWFKDMGYSVRCIKDGSKNSF